MNLYQARVLKEMTQWDMRKATGIHQSKISLFENGYLEPNEDEKARIANALGYSIKELFEIESETSFG